MKGWDGCEGGRRVKKGGDKVERSRVWRIDEGDERSMVKGRNGKESRERTVLKRIGCMDAAVKEKRVEDTHRVTLVH